MFDSEFAFKSCINFNCIRLKLIPYLVLLLLLLFNQLEVFSQVSPPRFVRNNVVKNYGDGFGSYYTLTGDKYSMNSSMWSEDKIDMNQDWTIEFKAYFGEDIGADGICFVIHNDPKGTSALGGFGHSIGYAEYHESNGDFPAISKSFCIEFDTFHNPLNGDYDMESDHIACVVNANIANPWSRKAINNLEDGLWHCIKIEWVFGTKTFKIYIDDLNIPIHTETFNSFLSILGSNTAFWGFTAGTNVQKNDQRIAMDNMVMTIPSTQICYGDAIELKTTHLIKYGELDNLDGPAFSWTPTIGLSDPNIESPIAKPETTTEYTVAMKTTAGISTNKVLITVNGKNTRTIEKIYGRGPIIISYFPDEEVMDLLKTPDCGFLIGMQSRTTDYNIFSGFNYLDRHQKTSTLFKTDCDGKRIEWQKMYFRDGDSRGLHHSCISQISNLFEVNEAPSFVACSNSDFVQRHIGYVLTGQSYYDQNVDLTLYKNEMYFSVINLNGEFLDSKRIFDDGNWTGLRTIQSKNGLIYSMGSTAQNNEFLISKLKFTNDPFNKSNCNLYSPDPTCGLIFSFKNQMPIEITDMIETEANKFIILGYYMNNMFLVKIDYNGSTPIIEWAKEYSGNSFSELRPISIIKANDNADYFYIAGNANHIIYGKMSFVLRVLDNGEVPLSPIKNGLMFRPYIYEDNNKRYVNSEFLKIEELSNGYLAVTSNNYNDYSLNNDFLSDASVLKIKKNLNYDQGNIISSDLYNKQSEVSYSDKIQTLTNIGFNGYSSLIETIIQSSDAMLVTSLDEGPICYNVQNYDVVEISFTKVADYEHTDFNSRVPVLDDVNFTEVNPIIKSTEICSTDVCYCDNQFIEVTIKHKNSEEDNCYELVFHKKYLGCDVNNVDISIAGSSDTYNFTISFDRITNEDIFKIDNFCLDEFDGMKTLILTYKDLNGNVVCETKKDIYGKCNCSDLKDLSKYRITVEPTFGGSQDNCCWNIRLKNELPCDLTIQGIRMSFPDFSNSNDFGEEILQPIGIDGWTPTNYYQSEGIWQVDWEKDNPVSVTNKETGFIIGTVCTKTSTNPTNVFKFQIITADGNVCENSIENDLDCDYNKCNNITIEAINSTDCSARFSIEVDEAIQEGFYEYSVNVIFPNSTVYGVNKNKNGWSLYADDDITNEFSISIPPIDRGEQSIKVIVQIVAANGDIVCSKEITCIVRCVKDCCENLNATIIRDAISGDEANCCYTLELVKDSNYDCENDVTSIKVVDKKYSNTVYFKKENIDGVPSGTSTYNFCVSQDIFNSNEAKEVSILINGNNCNKGSQLIPCDLYVESCSPDYPEMGWYNKTNQRITFECPSTNPPIKCTVDFNFSYRHVKSSGTSIHRDIQITSYKFNSECACEAEVINKMIAYILSDADVMSEFKLNQEQWSNNSTNCITNLRVVTSDCWERIFDQNSASGFVYTKKCPNPTCCYGEYRTCYDKDDEGNISFSYMQNLSTFKTTSNCSLPCYPNNCDSWIKPYFNNTPGGISLKQTEPQNNLDSIICSVQVEKTNNENEFNLNFKCSEKGITVIKIYDIFGNLLSSYKTEKQNYFLFVPIKIDASSGIYILNISIDDELIYRNLINIVK